MEEYWIWLAQALQQGGRFVAPVLERFSTAKEVWLGADRETLADIEEIGKKEVAALCKKDLKQARAILQKCEAKGIGVMTFEDENYPQELRNLFSPPLVLYYRGTLPDFRRELFFTVVGTRRATKEGEKTAYEIAGRLSSSGIWVVSGMADGIDASANQGAVSSVTPTLAVLGCGADVIYPYSSAALMEQILQHGAVISEFPPETKPLSRNFPIRNRIMAALGAGILVVEAPVSSGALITAHQALELGKEVFAVPGSIYSYQSEGSNRLLADGAHLTTCAADILECYQWEPSEKKEENRPSPLEGLQPLEQQIADLLYYHKQLFIDDMAQLLDVPHTQLMVTLAMMELKGIICNQGGDVYRIAL